jgi:transposase
MKRMKRFSPELKDRAVKLVFECQHEYDLQSQAIAAIAEKIGCSNESLRRWVRRAEGVEPRQGDSTVRDDKARIAQLEREVRELKKTNEILRLASAFFAQAELDRPRD